MGDAIMWVVDHKGTLKNLCWYTCDLNTEQDQNHDIIVQVGKYFVAPESGRTLWRGDACHNRHKSARIPRWAAADIFTCSDQEKETDDEKEEKEVKKKKHKKNKEKDTAEKQDANYMYRTAAGIFTKL